MRIVDICRKPVAEKSSVSEPKLNQIKGLSYEYNHYLVKDRNGAEIRGVCPLCYAKNRLISLLVASDEDIPLNAAHCPVCDTQYGLETWDLSDEARKRIEESKPSASDLISSALYSSIDKKYY